MSSFNTFLYLQANLVMSQIQPLSLKFCKNLAKISSIVSRFSYETDLYLFDLYFHMKKSRFSFHIHFKIRIQLSNSCCNYMLNFMLYLILFAITSDYKLYVINYYPYYIIIQITNLY